MLRHDAHLTRHDVAKHHVSAVRPNGAGARAFKLTLTHERRREVGGAVVLIARIVPVAIDEAVVRVGTCPVPCGQVQLSAKNRHSAA